MQPCGISHFVKIKIATVQIKKKLKNHLAVLHYLILLLHYLIY